MSNNEAIHTKAENNHEIKPMTREERRKQKEHIKVEKKTKAVEESTKVKKPRVRLLPIWLRLVIILILCIGAMVAGLVVGFSIIGEGEAGAIFEKETWQHIIDLVVKEA